MVKLYSFGNGGTADSGIEGMSAWYVVVNCPQSVSSTSSRYYLPFVKYVKNMIGKVSSVAVVAELANG